MNVLQRQFSPTRLTIPFAAVLVGVMVAQAARAGVDIHYSAFTFGTGQQFAYMPTNSISGVMSTTVPRFNPALGTLVQADFEWAGSITGTWVPPNNGPSGTSSFSLSGNSYADTELMGNLAVSFTGPYTYPIGSNDFDADFTNLTVTSGAFFNSLTGFGTVPMTWNYSGSNSLSTPASGTGVGGEGFSWGGSVHVAYFYVPEPTTLALGVLGVCACFARSRRR